MGKKASKLDAWLERHGLSPVAKEELVSLVGNPAEYPELTFVGAATGSAPHSSTSVRFAPRDDTGAAEMGFPATRYQGEAPLGAGSMGEVYRTRDLLLNRSVAVKVLRRKAPGSTPSAERFVQEAQITAQLQHHGIAPVYDMGTLQDGRPYFTMREVRGRTLGDAIRSVHSASQGGRWQQDARGTSLRRLLEAFQSACEAVAYAHARRVVHRDLKPSNIMLGEYGEVLVVDWGVAQLIAEPGGDGSSADRVVVNSARAGTKLGVVAGTVAYMAPEQALGESASPASDVFSLGAVLYEILCNRPPFAGRENTTISTTDGPRESVTLPVPEYIEDRPIADDLRAICARALGQDPRGRYPDAGALALDMAAWLEGAKSRARANAILAEATQSLEELDRLRDEACALHVAASELSARIPSFLPVEAKAAAWELEDRAAELERQGTLQSVKVSQSLRAALTHDAELPEAHALLAEHYLKEHRRAEKLGHAEDAARLALLIQDHGRGKYAAYLEGKGALTIVTDPPGAHVQLHSYELRDRRLQIGAAKSLGRTPIRSLELAMGSYLLVLRAEGCQDVHYPVSIQRLQHWDTAPPGGRDPDPIYLPRVGELAPDECYVPAGWFWSGGDGKSLGRRSVMARRRVWVDGFAIRKHHVTIAEYVTFLNTLLRDGRPDDALVAVPRAAGRQGEPGQMLLERREDGTFYIPANNYFGIPWQAEWPVIFVDWFSAVAYTRWKGSVAGRDYRLPMELEWEKAARGVDGRLFPWGNFLDPTWCRMLETHAGLPTMAAAGSYPVDESPYGVRDLAGNQRDWCLDVPREQGPPLSDTGRLLGYHDSHEAWNVRVARGGNFLDSPLWCSSYHRASFLPHLRDYTVSFRTARSLPGESPKALPLAADVTD